MPTILVAGGAGYIGSHTCISLLEAGYSVVVVDDFSNSRYEVISRIEKISGKKIKFYEGDVTKESDIAPIFEENKIDCVIHFAGKKAVGESVQIPLSYYEANLMATLTLCKVMKSFQVKRLVFSSSATVYGNSEDLPYKESASLGTCSNPYGWTKWMNEQILRDFSVAEKDWCIHLLRYFNPVGAHQSGSIGEDPSGIPNNLTPYITQVAVGKLEKLPLYGTDYPTKDGTCIRDYIHVMDLAEGHVASVRACLGNTGVEAINLGTGIGYSVYEVLHAFEKAVGKEIPYEMRERRPGDLPVSFAATEKAKKLLGWQATRSLEEMAADAWNWQKNNPQGYNK